MHLAVYGGSFDPPHNGHLALSLFARELLGIDRLIISVSNNPFKQSCVADNIHRMQMAELLAREINYTGNCCEVSRWELDKQQPSYTVDLLRYLHECYTHDRLTLLVGEDSFSDFSSWKEYEKLFLLCDVVVFKRVSNRNSDSAGDILHERESVRFIDFRCDVSSTGVRKLVAAGKSIAGLVPSSLRRYSDEHALYRQHPASTSLPEQKHQES